MKYFKKCMICYALIVLTLGATALTIYFLWPALMALLSVSVSLVFVFISVWALQRFHAWIWPLLKEKYKEL